MHLCRHGFTSARHRHRGAFKQNIHRSGLLFFLLFLVNVYDSRLLKKTNRHMEFVSLASCFPPQETRRIPKLMRTCKKKEEEEKEKRKAFCRYGGTWVKDVAVTW